MSNNVQDSVFLQYQAFCANPLRGEEQIAEEFEALTRNPRIKCIGFHRPDVLMVGTDEIIVTCEGKKRLIGEFIIFLFRQKHKGYWQVEFRFWNVTNSLYRLDEQGVRNERAFVHPHIRQATDEKLKVPNGMLCISKGQFGVYQHMRKGEMHYAASRLIEILETYPTGFPYLDAKHWPEWQGGRND